ncbi:MAG: AI-2E family transporter [Nitrospinae bacterium]|jgi:predicted PurR-regulated permease PerM|nr:AI-2E family transporter [Nitrospinota bacterium]MDA1109247.1 AI-2E family transporter [Nitrospinota bacterium]
MDQKTNYQTFILTLMISALLTVFLYYSRRVIMPFFVAFALAYLLDPLVDRLENWKLSRTLSVVSLMLVFFALILGACLLIFPLLRLQAENLTKSLPTYIDVVQNWLRPFLEKVAGLDQQKIQEILNEGMARFGELPLKILSFVSTFLWDSLSSLFSVLLMIANLVIIPVVMFYLLRDFDTINEKVLALIPPRFKEKTVETVREVDRVLASFVRGQLMVGLLMGLLYSTGLYVIGTPMSLFIGLVAGLANLVPYLGVIVGFFPAALLTYLQVQEWLPVLWVVGVFGVVQMLEGMVITPRVLGENIGLHPVAVIFAVLLGGELFGLVGIILGVPLVAVLNVLIRRGILHYKKSAFFSP